MTIMEQEVSTFLYKNDTHKNALHTIILYFKMFPFNMNEIFGHKQKFFIFLKTLVHFGREEIPYFRLLNHTHR